MMRVFLVGLLGLAFVSLPAYADHFTIDLEVKSPTATKTAHAEKLAPGEKAKPRLVVETKAGETLTVKWTLTSVSAQELSDVLVHCFIVREKALGQTETPKLDKDVLYESALTMDFKQKDKASGQFVLKAMKPGFYLLRVETIGAENRQNAHEHFAAMDIVVK